MQSRLHSTAKPQGKRRPDGDWIFSSARMAGRQPLWPDSLMHSHIAPSAKRAGIGRAISWHVLRHTFSTLLVGNGEDVKTAQSLMRHANPNITMGLYTHPVNSKKRESQTRVVEMIPPREMGQIAVMARGTAYVYPLEYHAISAATVKL